MPDAVLSALFPFEDPAEALDAPPLAARRALDVAGLRLASDGYRSLSMADRADLATLGVSDTVDVPAVERIVRRASPGPSRARPVPEPDAYTPPEQLAAALAGRRPVPPSEWARLRPVERYALVQVMRRSIAHDDFARLELAVAAIVPLPGSRRPPPVREALDRYVSDLPPSASRVPASMSARASGLPPPPAMPSALLRPASVPPMPPLPTAPSRPPSVRPPASSRPPHAHVEPVAPVSTHLNAAGEVHMIDVAHKEPTARRAVASGTVRMRPETAARLARGDAPKGEVLATARVAGILAAKRTPELIPLCHHVALTHVEVLADVEQSTGIVTITAIAEALDRTGVEMEALVAVSTACLTIYDMLKGIDRDLVVSDIRLVSKTGGKSGR